MSDSMLQRARGDKRIHCLLPELWAKAAASDFWAVFGNAAQLTGGTGVLLASNGWTTTALANLTPSAADFISSADLGTPNGLNFDAASDLLKSPVIFGDQTHALMVQEILGYRPSVLQLKFRAIMSAAGANETATGWGWFEDGGSPIVANDAFAMIVTDATTWIARSGADSDAGAAVDTNWHTFQIKISGVDGASATDAVEWFIDGTSQGTFDRENDELPIGFGAGIQAAGVNTCALAWVHIWYE